MPDLELAATSLAVSTASGETTHAPTPPEPSAETTPPSTAAGDSDRGEGAVPIAPTADEQPATEAAGAAQPTAAADPGAATPDAHPPADSLEALIAAHPALTGAVENDPALKESLAAMVSRNAELSAYQTVFPTAEEARHAATSAQFLAEVDRVYYSQDPAAPMQFLQQLYDGQFLRDPDSGDLIRDQRGEPISSGAYTRITTAYRDLLFNALSQHAAADNDPALGEAVELVRQRLGGAPTPSGATRSAPPTPASEPAARPAGAVAAATPGPAPERDIHQRVQRLEALLRAQDAGARRDATVRQEQPQADLADLAQAVGAAVRADIEQSLSAANLPPYVKSKVAEDIFAALNQQASADAAFQARMDALLRLAHAPGTAEGARARIVAAARAHARPRMGAVAQRVLTAAGAGLREQRQATAAKLAEQRRRVEVKASGNAPNPTRRSSFGQIQQLEHSLGRRLSDREILDL